ncbi:MAG TPA: hypothetical protein PL024_06165 [Thauera sp.]|jgi:hypothetical protein|nr:hypothetical protein [Thauera sp.]HRA81069.1 hypothetical protein [Thauera sp.]
MSTLKAGSRLKSAVCDAEVMVVRAAAVEVSLECGGAGMIPMAADKPAGVAPSEAFAQGTLVGKRYTDADDRFELLCTKGGKGSLSIDGALLGVKQAKALPSSD